MNNMTTYGTVIGAKDRSNRAYPENTNFETH